MRIELLEDKEVWDNFVASQERSQFLQSWNWGEFKKSLGSKIWRVAAFEHQEVIAAVQIIKRYLPFKYNYLYVPRGPIFSPDLSLEKTKEVFSGFLTWIKKIAKEENSVFLKIEPPFIKDKALDFEELGFQKAETIQPPDTIIMDLERSEEEMLKAMHHKTRYNIRLAQRKGVEVIFSEDKNDLNGFCELIRIVNKREGINSFSEEYYKNMFNFFLKDKAAKLVKGIYKGKVIVMNLVIYYGDTVTYNHGASANECRNVMAPHLVQWETIRRAKAEGYKFYDFRGIAPSDDPEHKWAGLTRFKKGFSREIVHYLGAYDLAFKPFFYQLYLLGKKLK